MLRKTGRLSILFVALLSPLELLEAKTLDVSVLAGTDSNPFRLSDQFSPQDALYLATDIDFRKRFESGFGVSADLSQTSYESDAGDADLRLLSLGGDYRSRFELGGIKTRFKADLKLNDQDKTYVSRSTGQIGTVNGQPVPDRYDARWMDLSAGLTFSPSRTFGYGISGDYRTRNYEDYTGIGASNLDYDHWSLRFSGEYRINRQHRLEAYYQWRQREYDQRSGRDQLGNLVAGTALEYDYSMFQLSWRFKIDKTQTLSAYAYLENREDNVSGYYDTTWKRYRLRYRLQPSKGQKLTATLTYRDYAYDINDVLNTIEGEDPINAKKGFEYEVDYQHRIAAGKRGSWWGQAGFNYVDFDNASPAYVYDRSRLEMGVRYEY